MTATKLVHVRLVVGEFSYTGVLIKTCAVPTPNRSKKRRRRRPSRQWIVQWTVTNEQVEAKYLSRKIMKHLTTHEVIFHTSPVDR